MPPRQKRVRTNGATKSKKAKGKSSEDVSLKKAVGGDDFFIASESEEDNDNNLDGEQKAEDSEDEDEEIEETADEKRIRMAKEYLKSLDLDKEEASEDEALDDPIAHRLQKDILQEQGILQRKVADKFAGGTYSEADTRVLRGHRLSPTCLALSRDDSTAFTGSKDCSIIKWDIETGARSFVSRRTRKEVGDAHTKQVLAVATCDDGSLLASGGADHVIKIWDLRSSELITTFKGHRDTVSCLVFRRANKELYSGSHDRTVRVWNCESMGFVEQLFGHFSEVTSIDSLHRHRVLSAGTDKTLRLWKIVDETQLMYKGGHTSAVDCAALLTEETYCSGGQDGQLAVWVAGKKKPVSVVANAHGGEWITSLCAHPYSDMVCSGSSDGMVRLWHCQTADGSKKNKMEEIAKLPVVGFVNGVRVSNNCDFLVAAVGQEHRLGRWQRQQKARNGIQVVSLKAVNEGAGQEEDEDAVEEGDVYWEGDEGGEEGEEGGEEGDEGGGEGDGEEDD